ncbi:hypothetical protein, partial [Mesorhizobium sp. M0060]|uniref:hypothetical protein n=1 Tax=Mesorhizobium sp. M0060 TaxID=2956866 RepID=UPI00333CC395
LAVIVCYSQIRLLRKPALDAPRGSLSRHEPACALIWVQEHQNVWSEPQGEANEAIGETAQRASVAKPSPRQTVYSAPGEVHSCPDEMQKTQRPDGQ